MVLLELLGRYCDKVAGSFWCRNVVIESWIKFEVEGL
jgi:hypothetical protein